MKSKVVVLGGGVGGLSAAHELVQKGYDVHIYERQPIAGGKARSIPVSGTGTYGRHDLPGEHGFRFFPGFYQHISDTLKKIPFSGNEEGVFGNLVDAPRSLVARAGQSDPRLITRMIKSLSDLPETLPWVLLHDLGLPCEEACFFAKRMLAFATSCDERRLQQWEQISWWDFCRADEKSQAYRDYVARGSLRALVALRAERGSTRTVGKIVTQLLYDLVGVGREGAFDRLLNGPTNEVWIDPWVAYLQRQGVTYHREHTVTSLELDARGAEVAEVEIEHHGRTQRVTADHFVLALPVERVVQLLTDDLCRAAPELAGLPNLTTQWMNGIQFYLTDRLPLPRGHAIYTDAPWALTSVCQEKFWDQSLAAYGSGRVRGVLSVVISDWEKKGILYDKPAKELGTRQAIKDEVWEQIKRELNGRDTTRLHDDQLVDWFLDPDIVIGPNGTTNEEPLLVNTVGSLRYRPDARTSIPNLFLAADYVRTNTDLATMEGANEAARRAVNAILDADGSTHPRCEIWPLWQPPLVDRARRLDRERWRRGEPPCFAPDLTPDGNAV